MEVYKEEAAQVRLEDQDFFRFRGVFREVHLYGVRKDACKGGICTWRQGLDDAYEGGTPGGCP
ncbi:MAG: hypothetical protein ACLTLQ_02080 [[Clostridium] scindens]